MHVVWFKRDLRVRDHAALTQAAACGPVLPLYILEPNLWSQPDMSGRQFAFLTESLVELDAALQRLGSRLVIRVGEATDVLEALHRECRISSLWSHQQTWNGWTYQRDLAVKDWCQARRIPWQEPSQFGVIRRLADRDAWMKPWYGHVQAAKLKPLKLTPHAFKSDPLPNPQPDPCPGRQVGGRKAAVELLTSFLKERGETYTRDMSSPVSAFEACSRLSPHLAFGTLSIREAFQAAKAHPASNKNWRSAQHSFTRRLRWHCHFIQRLEDQPSMEFQNLHRAYDGLRGQEEARLTAWQAGKTGYPMIDACMRALTATGWLNFRMRSMLMSFASYHLWLDWWQPALHLARQFTDYEPGIHYSQVQMQSGTTGMNAVRVYNPIKQGLDQDPDGVFIRQWVPELRDMPTSLIHAPWLAPDKMGSYPLPIVEEKRARQEALDRLFSVRRTREHRAEAAKVVKQHGSRARRPVRRMAKAPSPQIELPL